MKPILLIRFALLLAPLAVLSAAEHAPIKPGTVFEYAVRPVPSYRVTQEDKGKETLELVEPEFSEKASEAERDRYVREVVFPTVQADATAGRYARSAVSADSKDQLIPINYCFRTINDHALEAASQRNNSVMRASSRAAPSRCDQS